ncbi:Syd protein [Streptomyces lydicamycinicus]|uniref:Syd protein n=1 Tax=Streptomyces lydicamycinicus TaxID=1546107 RepID=A0A0P4R350_9ACTN|nr:SSI family serine proteinase inhibitor [Streptomyces lydicamycinicus]GAO07090.1 Syd protein [Streptomyces lydicamycinicus]
MPYRRMSSFLTAAATTATAATTAVSRLSTATSATTAASRRSATASAASAAVSVVSAAAVLALAAPAAVAAPIPLPHVRSGDGVIGAGHHAPTPKPLPVGRPLPVGHHSAAGHHSTTGHHSAAGHHSTTGHHSAAGHHSTAGQPAPENHHAPVNHAPADHRAPDGHRSPTDHRPPTGQDPDAPYPGVVDHLTVTVHGTGSAGADGTFELYCHPARGNHPHAKEACKKLDGMTRWGRDPFAPVPQGANCTMIYGGPATAHITGTWAGRPVNADFRRTNGCEISRWSSFEPLLPSTGS